MNVWCPAEPMLSVVLCTQISSQEEQLAAAAAEVLSAAAATAAAQEQLLQQRDASQQAAARAAEGSGLAAQRLAESEAIVVQLASTRDGLTADLQLAQQALAAAAEEHDAAMRAAVMHFEGAVAAEGARRLAEVAQTSRTCDSLQEAFQSRREHLEGRLAAATAACDEATAEVATLRMRLVTSIINDDNRRQMQVHACIVSLRNAMPSPYDAGLHVHTSYMPTPLHRPACEASLTVTPATVSINVFVAAGCRSRQRHSADRGPASLESSPLRRNCSIAVRQPGPAPASGSRRGSTE